MKRLLPAILVFLVLFSLCSCTRKGTPVPSGADFVPRDNELYTAYVYVQYVDGDGFAGSGTFRDGVYVAYPGADAVFRTTNTVKVEFFGRDYRVEDKTFSKSDNFTFTSNQTVTSAVSAAKSDPAKDEPVYEKPILYFYPETDTVCSVRLELDGALTCSYPPYGENGWERFTASPDGTLRFENGGEYYALYWEGTGVEPFDFTTGFCVKGSDTAAFLADVLPRLGLSAREANEFIVYWLPILQQNPYNLISFPSAAYAKAARLTIEPKPDTLIRVYMTYQPLTAPVEIEPPLITTPERVGFTVVEWGGGPAVSEQIAP